MDSDVRRKIQGFLCLALVLCCCAWADGEVEPVDAKAGATVTFKWKKTFNPDEQLLWTFETSDRSIMIAKITYSEVRLSVLDQFQSRINLDKETGDLILSNLTVNDTGQYKQQRIGPFISYKLFKLTVYNPLSTPSVDIVQIHPGGCQPLLIECSTENSRNLSLSWFRGTVQLKNMSSVELARLSLPLELGLGETSKYICEAQNPMEKQSMNFDPNQLCLKKGETGSCHNELMVRLILSAIIGLVMIALVVDHLRIRN
ncbi:uncharacterized protein LOC117369554 [Periophthalmus magnuspinnatus]|uniref:uncharacterized protein LOC117369554 n=1 Tax=Periophthalmus magnuspinnatus TaxID=409849 RepID=UPI00145B7A75|nr:uncharacterized protein LOC117369554 [Periophthalmus magnuspinnatus]